MLRGWVSAQARDGKYQWYSDIDLIFARCFPVLLLFSRSILSVWQSHDTHLSSLLLWILAYSQYSALGFQFFLKIWFHGHNILFDCWSTGSQLLARSTCRSTAYHIHFKRQVHHFPGIRRDLTRHNSRRHPAESRQDISRNCRREKSPFTGGADRRILWDHV